MESGWKKEVEKGGIERGGERKGGWTREVGKRGDGRGVRG